MEIIGPTKYEISIYEEPKEHCLHRQSHAEILENRIEALVVAVNSHRFNKECTINQLQARPWSQPSNACRKPFHSWTCCLFAVFRSKYEQTPEPYVCYMIHSNSISSKSVIAALQFQAKWDCQLNFKLKGFCTDLKMFYKHEVSAKKVTAANCAVVCASDNHRISKKLCWAFRCGECLGDKSTFYT